MKKILIGLLIAALCMAGFAVAEGAGDAYLGEWVSGRATMEIVADGEGYDVSIHWGSSYDEAAEWVYEGCLYDDVSGGLSSFEVGVKAEVTYGENGEVVSSREVYNDGAAAFVINEEGKLVWTDFKETPGENEVTFERMERVETAATPNEAGAYRVIVRDEDGNPVKGAVVQLCDDSTCSFQKTGEDGVATFQVEKQKVYEVHVAKVPVGYAISDEAYLTLDTFSDVNVIAGKTE